MLKLATYFLLIPCLMGCATSSKMNSISFANNPVVAHRGAFKKNGFPENSIASLKEAIRLGCTGSEFDIRMTADDSLVINHDPHYQKLEIEKVTYKELLPFPLKNGEPIPTLRQYLLAGLDQNKRTRLILEIKPSGISKERGQVIADKVVAMVKVLKAEKMSAYISFDYDIVKRVHAIDPTAITQHLNGDIDPVQLKKDGISGLDYNMSVFRKKPEWITSAKAEKLQLNAWTVNKKEDLQWFLDAGFDFITTNEPELLLEMWGGRKVN